MIRLVTFLFLFGTSAMADTVVATRTIPAKAIIGPSDVLLNAADVPGAVTNPDAVIGMEARVALFAGRPIRPGDVGFPATVERNQIITLYYHSDGLSISTDGRALGRAGPGDTLRVMNLSSRTTVTARIGADGSVYVTE